MSTTPYEEQLAALGITDRDRGQLASGFEDAGFSRYQVSHFTNPRSRTRDFIRPVAEDLTRLNPPATVTIQKAQKAKRRNP